MSRRFSGSGTQYLCGDLVGLTGVPFTISCWVKKISGYDEPIATLYSTIVSLHNRDAGYNPYWYTSNDVVELTCTHSTASQVVLNSVTGNTNTLYGFNANSWNHVGGIFSSISNRTFYLNGYSQSTSTTVSINGSLDKICINKPFPTALPPPSLLPYPSDEKEIAEVGIWNEALSHNEMLSLGSGVSPYLIRPSSLVAYYPMTQESRELNVLSGNYLEHSGSSTVGETHPQLIKPRFSKVKYPDSRFSYACNLYLHGALRYGSGVLPGGFSGGFGSGFSGGYGPDDLLGAPPGWHMNMFAYNAGTSGGYAQSTGTIPLYTSSHYHIDNITPSFDSGFSFGYERQNYFPLFAKSTPEGNPSGLMNLYVQAPTAVGYSGSFDLYTWATTNSGIRNTFDLFVNCERTGTFGSYLNLFVLENRGLSSYGSMNLFAQGPDNRSAGGIDLFVQNSWQPANSGLDMFVQVASGTEGAVPFSGMMNLYLETGTPRWAGSCELYAQGARSAYSGVNMFVHAQPNTSSGIPLFTQGMIPAVGTIELYTSGY